MRIDNGWVSKGAKVFRLIALTFVLAVGGSGVMPNASAQSNEDFLSFRRWPEARSAHWNLRALPLETSGEIQTARIGQFLFRQEFVSVREAVLLETAVAHRPAIRPAPVTLPAGMVFVEANLGNDLRGFCSPDAAWKSGMVLLGQTFRVCLLDADADDVFDYPYWSLMNMGEGSEFTAPLLLVRTYAPNLVHVRYQIQAGGTRQLTAGVVITRSPLGAYRLNFAVADERDPVVLHTGGGRAERRARGSETQDGDEIYFRSVDLPIRLTLAGSEVEISSIDSDVVSYRVVKGFAPSEAMGIAHMRALPSPFTQ